MTTRNKNSNHEENARRRLLKTIAGTGGAIAAGSMLPEKWTRPVVDQALLPAHAQTSVCTEICDMNISLEWDGPTTATPLPTDDVDLELETPGGNRIAPKAANGVLQGNCVAHQGDERAQPGTTGIVERIQNIGAGVTPGHYAVFARLNSPNPVFVELRVTGCYGGGTQQWINPTSPVLRLLSFDVPAAP